MMKRYLTLKPLQNGTTFHEPGSIVELADIDARWCADIGVIDPEPVADGVQVVTKPTAAPALAPSAPAHRGCAGCGWR